MKVPVGVSNRHIHLNNDDLEILFGKNYVLKKLKDVNQPGEYASVDTVSILTKKNRIDNVRVLGPIRNYTQVEISKTDAYKLGLNPPVRVSGDLAGSEEIVIVGPNNVLRKKESCIQANRHIHISLEKLEELGFKEDDIVRLKIDGEKGGIIGNVIFRVSENAYFEVHLDTDDANAFMLKNNDEVEIIK